ncbi:MAG: ATP-dependent helicase [Candidatus Bathyarchaeia archaeon]
MKRTAIFGPPGTGKTTKLLEVIEQELEAGVQPLEIAFVSFTNAAVNEAKKRTATKFKLKQKDMFWFRTIHSLCFSLSRLPGQQVITSYDLKVFAQIHRVIEFSNNPRRKERGDIALEAYNLARAAQISLKDAWMASTDWIVHDFSIMEDFVTAYEEWKMMTGKVDFQDMIDNYLASPIKTQVKVSIIDEVQDLNGQQWEVIENTFSESERQYVAGDDDQSIYAWSGSRVDKMLEYPADEKIILEQSYRCPRKVAAVANLIVNRIETRQEKHWAPRDAAGSFTMYGDYTFVPFAKHKDESWFILARSDFMLDDIRWWLKSIGEIYRDEKGYSVNNNIAQKIMTIIKLQQGESVQAESLRRAVWESSLDYNVLDLVHLPTKGMVTAEEANIDLKKVDPVGIFSRTINDTDTLDYYQRALAIHKDLTKQPLIELSTIHKVKGREADNVVVLLDQTGNILDAALLDPDNEHRNWYVAVTRAKKRLMCIMASAVHSYDL